MTSNHHQSTENARSGSDNSNSQNTPESFVRDFMKDFMREFPDVWTQLQCKQSDVSKHLPGVEFTDSDCDGNSGSKGQSGGSDRGSNSHNPRDSDNSNDSRNSDNSNHNRHGSGDNSNKPHCDDDGDSKPPEQTPTPDVPCAPETPPPAPPEAPPVTAPPEAPPVTAPSEAPTAPDTPPMSDMPPCEPDTPTLPADPQVGQQFFNSRQYGATLLNQSFEQADKNGDNRISAKEARQLIREKYPNPFDSEAIRDVLKHWKGVKSGAVDGRHGVSQEDLLASIERQRQRGVLKGFDPEA